MDFLFELVIKKLITKTAIRFVFAFVTFTTK